MSSLAFLMSSSTQPAAPTVTSPVPYQIFQRGATTGAMLIQGTSSSPYSSIQAQATAVNGGTSVGWTTIAGGGNGAFSGQLNLVPGLYNLSVRVIFAGIASGSSGVSSTGIGEVFLCMGQSLMASWGQTVNVPTDNRVMKTNPSGVWAPATDPQQNSFFGSNGNGNGSICPILGSSLAVYLNMPIGFLDFAVGNTSSNDWLTTWYDANLVPALRLVGNTNFRCLMWEQGQNDGANNVTEATYISNLQTLIANSRSAAGWTIPWGIAISTIEANNAYINIQNAQIYLATPANVPGGATFQGSDTDSLPSGDRFDGTHLTQTGQTAQSALWEAAIKTYFGW